MAQWNIRITQCFISHRSAHLPTPTSGLDFLCVSAEDAIMAAPTAPLSAPTPPPRPLPAIASSSDTVEELGQKKKKMVSLRAVRAKRSLALGESELREQMTRTIESQFKPVDLTKEMAETYYYGRQDVSLLVGGQNNQPNSFWLDLVQWQGNRDRSFLSHVSF